MRNHPGRVITVYQIAQILTPAYLKATTSANAIQSFKISGIQPFNPDVFGEQDFLASAVTERPLTPISDNSPQPSCSTNETSGPPLVESDRARTPLACLSPQPSCSTNEASGPPLVESDKARTPLACLHIQNTESPHIPIEDIAPLPLSEYLSRSNRKRAKSDILSGSPYKLAFEESLASKNVPKRVPKPLLKATLKKANKTAKAPKKMLKKKVYVQLAQKSRGRSDWVLKMLRVVA